MTKKMIEITAKSMGTELKQVVRYQIAEDKTVWYENKEQASNNLCDGQDESMIKGIYLFEFVES